MSLKDLQSQQQQRQQMEVKHRVNIHDDEEEQDDDDQVQIGRTYAKNCNFKADDLTPKQRLYLNKIKKADEDAVKLG